MCRNSCPRVEPVELYLSLARVEPVKLYLTLARVEPVNESSLLEKSFSGRLFFIHHGKGLFHPAVSGRIAGLVAGLVAGRIASHVAGRIAGHVGDHRVVRLRPASLDLYRLVSAC